MCDDGGNPMAGIGKVEKYMLEKLRSDGAMLFALIDPLDHKDVESAARRVKENVNVPVVLFPGNISTLTPYADAVYYMSLRNSRNPYWIAQAQTLAAHTVKKVGIEPLPVGYIVV